MGPAYMEDDVRMETNRLGFCAAHIEKMYASQNRLGLALMLHTYMQRLNRETDAAIQHRLPVPRFKKAAEGPSAKLRDKLTAAEASCYVCGMVERTFERYMDTFFTLWSNDREAVALIEGIRGYCLPHFTQMLQAAEERLSKAKLTALLDTVIPAQQLFMKQLEEDLEWFTLKFDYRNVNAPWKNAKDALPRAMALLHGGSHRMKEGLE